MKCKPNKYWTRDNSTFERREFTKRKMVSCSKYWRLSFIKWDCMGSKSEDDDRRIRSTSRRKLWFSLIRSIVTCIGGDRKSEKKKQWTSEVHKEKQWTSTIREDLPSEMWYNWVCNFRNRKIKNAELWGQKRKQSCFRKLAGWIFFYRSTASIFEKVSEYLFVTSRKQNPK